MSDWNVTFTLMLCYVLCQRETQPAKNYQFFRNLCQFTKMYVTNFAQSQFWWIADSILISLNASLTKFLSRSTLMLTILYISVVNQVCALLFQNQNTKSCFVLPFNVENKLYRAH